MIWSLKCRQNLVALLLSSLMPDASKEHISLNLSLPDQTKNCNSANVPETPCLPARVQPSLMNSVNRCDSGCFLTMIGSFVFIF